MGGSGTEKVRGVRGHSILRGGERMFQQQKIESFLLLLPSVGLFFLEWLEVGTRDPDRILACSGLGGT